MKRLHLLIGLLVLATIVWLIMAFLIIPVGIVYLASTTFTRYQEPSAVSQDKSFCAASGIELLNYFHRYESAQDYAEEGKIGYIGKKMDCIVGSMPTDTGTSCKIATSEPGNDWIRIYANRNGCFVEDIQADSHGVYQEPQNPFPYVLIALVIGLVLDTIFIIGLLVAIVYAYKNNK